MSFRRPLGAAPPSLVDTLRFRGRQAAPPSGGRTLHRDGNRADSRAMMFLLLKALISGAAVVAVSEIAKRNPGFGALVASLPLVSILGMVWLWRDKPDAANMADHAQATFWFVLPSLPMFLLIPALLRRGVPFWPSLLLGCGLTVALYFAMTWIAPRVGLRL
jgi:hypothetical protein